MSEKKVLLVDDDADFIDLNKAVLKEKGFAVLTAYNGQECLRIAHEEHPEDLRPRVALVVR